MPSRAEHAVKRLGILLQLLRILPQHLADANPHQVNASREGSRQRELDRIDTPVNAVGIVAVPAEGRSAP